CSAVALDDRSAVHTHKRHTTAAESESLSLRDARPITIFRPACSSACRWAAANSGVPAKTMRRSELFMKWPCWLGKRLPRDHPGKEKACRSKPSDLKGSGVGLRLVQLLQFLADAVTLEVGQIIHEQLAIQVIALMLDADRQQAFTNDVEGLAVT